MRRSLLLGLTLCLAACSTSQRIGTEKSIAKALVSDEQEAQIGAQVQAELDKQGVRYVTDPAITSYVQGVVNRLLPFAMKDRRGSYDLKVIDDPKTVNAFVTPGGHIYVFTGLLATAENEAELAGVLGHELGHVVARHAARQMVEAFGLQSVLGLALGKNPNLAAQLGAAVLGQGAMLANSRSDENEADEYGVKYNAQAGYNPHGIATFFEKLMKGQGRTPKALEFLSTHPASENRIAHVNQLIAKGGYTGGELAPERLAPVKAKITSGAVASAPNAPAGTAPAGNAPANANAPYGGSGSPPANAPANQPSPSPAPPSNLNKPADVNKPFKP